MKLSLYISIASLCTSALAFASSSTDSDSLQNVTLNELSVTAIKQGNNLEYQAVSSSSITRGSLAGRRSRAAQTASGLVPLVCMADGGSRVSAA